MNVQELLTYVEELAFKTSMFGYDKDEVDIQLDKICDEVEAMMAEKEKTIQALKSGIIVESVQGNSADEKIKVAKEEEILAEGKTQQSENTEVLQETHDTEKKELKEQIVRLTKELQESKDQLFATQEELDGVKAQLADAGESLERAIERAEMAEERADAAQKMMAEKQVDEPEETVEETTAAKEAAPVKEEIPETKDEAYQQYLRNADLLCRQLADLQSRQDSIVEKANTQAKEILDSANTEAAKVLEATNTETQQMVSAAKEKVEQINQESEERIKEAAAKAKKIRKNSQFRVSQEQKRYDALVEKKNNLIEYFGAITADIQQLVEKVQLPIKEVPDVNEDTAEEME